MNNIVEVKNISFCYGRETVFSDVNFCVRKGDFAAIIGPNGAGKSTVMKTLLGEVSVFSGEIFLFGQSLSDFKDWQAVGYVPQDGLKNTEFPATVAEIVSLNLSVRNPFFADIEARKKRILKVREALKLVEMENYEKKLFRELSGGQRQRVILARTLVVSPQLLLLDEPATGIDSETMLNIYKILSKLNKDNVTIIMVTHDAVRASSYVNRVFCIEEGTLIELERNQLNDEISHKHRHIK
jgi:zinc transport system ATP-binding protein